LNAVIETMYDQAREAVAAGLPEGPFRGVPFLIKDLAADYAGVPSTYGCRSLRDYRPDHDSEIVRRHKAAGLAIVGKTNAPELGLMPVTEPELFGPAHNPWDLTRTPGGSSGGSAAAVAARMVPLAHGNDGGGSIRIPASCCGLFGLKPTRGRTPIGPDVAEGWQGLVVNHVLTRSVRDSAAMLDATAGPEVGAPYYAAPPARPFLSEVGADPGRLRIAVTAQPLLPAEVHPDCVAGVQETARLCEELGHDVVEATPCIDGQAFARAFLILSCAETRAAVTWGEQTLGRRAGSAHFEAKTWAMALLGDQFSAGELSVALALLKGTGRAVGGFFEEFDVLLTPTLARLPLEIGALQLRPRDRIAAQVLGRLQAGRLIRLLIDLDEFAAKLFDFIPFAPVFNATGQPAMSVPLIWNKEGLPIGMHFVGRHGDEATLLRLAAQLEQARPWAGRVPPVHS
jgi:amidase